MFAYKLLPEGRQVQAALRPNLVSLQDARGHILRVQAAGRQLEGRFLPEGCVHRGGPHHFCKGFQAGPGHRGSGQPGQAGEPLNFTEEKAPQGAWEIQTPAGVLRHSIRGQGSSASAWEGKGRIDWLWTGALRCMNWLLERACRSSR